MNKNQEYLSQVRIATPCSADWDKMSGDDRMRHCQQCNLNVFNISEMTEDEATKLIQNKTGRLCIQMYKRKDGTVITKDCPKGLERVRRAYRKCAVAAASMVAWLGFTGPGYAQLGGEAVLPEAKNNNSSHNQVRGRVKPIRGKVAPGYFKKQNDGGKKELGNYLPPIKGEAAPPPIMGDVCPPTKQVLRGAPVPPPTKAGQKKGTTKTTTKPGTSNTTEKNTKKNNRNRPQNKQVVPPTEKKKAPNKQSQIKKNSTQKRVQARCGVELIDDPASHIGPAVNVVDNVDIKSKKPVKCGVMTHSTNTYTLLKKEHRSGNGLLASGLAIMLLAAVSKFVFGNTKRRSSIWIVGSSFAVAFIAIGLLWQFCL